jgi:hypothetical protein
MSLGPGVQLYYGFAVESRTLSITVEGQPDNFTSGEVEDIHDFFKTLIETKISQSAVNSQANNILSDIVIQDPS